MAIRVRQHVNPLHKQYQTPIVPPDWQQVYANPTQALHLDIGCAKGNFLLQLAQLQPHINFLGIEIREPLVISANQQREKLKSRNLYYLFCNISNSLAVILESFPSDTLQFVTIQFPDPWFKQRHAKRRIVQPELVTTLAEYLAEGGKILLQSDIEAVAVEMSDRFTVHPAFIRKHSSWLEHNPLPIATERENYTLAQDKPVYRALFQKTTSTSAS